MRMGRLSDAHLVSLLVQGQRGQLSYQHYCIAQVEPFFEPGNVSKI